MKALSIFIYASLGLILAAGIASFFFSQNQTTTVEGTYDVKVITKEINLSGPNKLVVEKDGQRMRCYGPSSDDIKNKAPLNCDAVTKIDAKQ